MYSNENKIIRKRILIIEDNLKEAESMKRSFQQLGWEVVDTAERGDTGIKMISIAYEKCIPYQVILLDYLLPEMKGFKVMEEIAARWPEQCVVFLTGVALSLEDGVRGMQLGACGYLQKPFRPDKDELEILRAIRINSYRQIKVIANGIIHQVGGRALTSAFHIQRAMGEMSSAEFPIAYKELEQALEDIRSIDYITHRFRTDFELLKRGESMFDLDQAVESAIRRSREGFAYRFGTHKTPHIETQIEKGIKLHGKQVWIEEACAILVDNALEAVSSRNQEGQVYVKVESQVDHILISVRDNGEGISEEARSLIFTPGYTTRPGRGTGQGLAFVKNLVERLYQGEISFTSKQDEGTEFFILLPG